MKENLLGQFVVTNDNMGLFKVIFHDQTGVYGFNLLNGKLIRRRDDRVTLLKDSQFLKVFRFSDEVAIEIALVLFKTKREKAEFMGVSDRTFYRKMKEVGYDVR